MVIFHSYVSHYQMVIKHGVLEMLEIGPQKSVMFLARSLSSGMFHCLITRGYAHVMEKKHGCPLKNMKVSWDDDIPNIWKNKVDVPVTTNQKIS